MKITDAMRHEFLSLLSRTGNLTTSARIIGVSRTAIYNLRARDPHFDDACDLAIYKWYADIADIRESVVDSAQE